MFETATHKMVDLGHDINAKYWTSGERGFSNACLNCGRVIGVLKTGDLWGTALNGPCPDQRWYAVSQNRPELSSRTRAHNVAEAPRAEHQALKGMVIFLGLLAAPIVTIAVLVHFRLLSGFLVIFSRITFEITAILLIVAIFRRAGFKPALLMLLLSMAFAVLSVVVMSPRQRAEWEAKEQEARTKIDADRKAQKDSSAVHPAQPQPSIADLAEQRRDEQNQLATAAAYGYTLVFNAGGSDTKVTGFDDVLVFDCSKELDPRVACYTLYKGFRAPDRKTRLALQKYGIHHLKFKTDDGLFHGFDWQLDVQ
jgi:hypothetical protein